MNKNTKNIKKVKETKSARSLAMESLISLERDGRYSNLEVNSALIGSSLELEKADRGLYTRLVYGVTERRITLDYIIGKYSRVPSEQLDPDVRCALRLGLYQLLWMDRIPHHAAVCSSAELVAKRSTGFVNAILRSFLRDGKKYDLPDKNVDYMQYLSVAYSVPRDLCELLAQSVNDKSFDDKSFDDGELEDLLEAMNREPHISLRVNSLKISVNEAAAMLGGEKSKIAPDIINVQSFDDTVKSGIDSGLWFVQDEASRVASVAVGAKPGETVVDTCACPGGKSFSIAIDMQNSGSVYSFDLHKNKLSLIESGAGRLGITIIKTEERDARTPNEALIGKADRVLCDAPCSGLGVIAKKPDIRYKDLSAVERLPEVQYQVLCGSAEYVRTGGVLVYSTCTINKAENDGVVEKFLSEHKNFAPTPNGIQTFYPHRDNCDGFYCAKMIKIKE